MKHLSIDLETYSSIPIAKAGAYKYIQSSDFEILLMAYSVDGAQVQIIDLAQGEEVPNWLTDALKSPDWIKHAYNASFEWYCLSKLCGEILPIEQWRDTMLHGLYCGFTAGLEATGEAIGLPEDKRKLTTGKALIRYFCVPCKPTKSNGGRTRNLPKHDPEKWQLFKEYCIGDVVTEMEIERRLSGFPVPNDIQEQWQIDIVINSRGVAIDMDLIHGALDIAENTREKLMSEAVELTGLENPNSVAQLSKWLAETTGEEIDNLRKDTVARMIDSQVVTGDAARVLKIRQELGKTSTKKYDAIKASVCEDNRVRGLLQFYGASRTGRWAGRLINVQNVVRTSIDTNLLPMAREAVKKREVEKLEVLFGSTMDTLSQLIRTSFIASDGNKLIDADFSSIEARVVAWLAKEEWKIDAFNTGKDIYCETASAMFGIPVEKHGINSELRQKGKIAELACIAEGQLVLTDKGLVPIENITKNHRLWDGKSWVRHDGVIYRGEREVITYEGLTATPDHLVWVEGVSRAIHFGIAATSGAHLLQTGNSRTAIRLGKNNIIGKKMELEMGSLLCTDAMYRLRKYTMATFRQFSMWKIQRLSALFVPKTDSQMAGQKINRREATLRKSQTQTVPKLRGAWNQILFLICFGSRIVDYAKRQEFKSGKTTRSYRHQRQLRTRQPSFRNTETESLKPPYFGNSVLRSPRMAVCALSGNTETGGRNEPQRNNSIGSKSSSGKAEKLEEYRRKVRVYDIRNAGPRNRFTVSNCLVHNCGYGGGANALIAMGALDMGIPEDDLPDIVARWRQANPKIVDLWYRVESAALNVVQTGRQTGTNGLVFAREIDYANGMDFLTIRIPSGRKLYYAHPDLTENCWGKPSISYWGVDQTTKQWTLLETYSGKLVENIVQAIARDCLAVAIQRLEAAGYPIVFHVHDEVVIDCAANKADIYDVVRIMTTPIPWANGLPMNADGWIGDFFRKD